MEDDDLRGRGRQLSSPGSKCGVSKNDSFTATTPTPTINDATYTTAASPSFVTAPTSISPTTPNNTGRLSTIQSKGSIFASIKSPSSPTRSGSKLHNQRTEPDNAPAKFYNILQILDELGDLSGVVEDEARWTVDGGARGGLNVFRATEFKNRLDGLSQRCEQVAGEAEMAAAQILEGSAGIEKE